MDNNTPKYSEVPMIEIENIPRERQVTQEIIITNLKNQLNNMFKTRYGPAINEHEYTLSPLLAANVLGDLRILHTMDMKFSGSTKIIKKYNIIFGELEKLHKKSSQFFNQVDTKSHNSICLDVNRGWLVLKTVYRIIVIFFVVITLSIVCVIYKKLQKWF